VRAKALALYLYWKLYSIHINARVLLSAYIYIERESYCKLQLLLLLSCFPAHLRSLVPFVFRSLARSWDSFICMWWARIIRWHQAGWVMLISRENVRMNQVYVTWLVYVYYWTSDAHFARHVDLWLILSVLLFRATHWSLLLYLNSFIYVTERVTLILRSFVCLCRSFAQIIDLYSFIWTHSCVSLHESCSFRADLFVCLALLRDFLSLTHLFACCLSSSDPPPLWRKHPVGKDVLLSFVRSSWRWILFVCVYIYIYIYTYIYICIWI